MGLDNGISVRRTDFTHNLSEMRKFEDSWDRERKYDFDICYWRKCWNIRNQIFALLPGPHEPNNSHIKLNLQDLINIQNMLYSLNEFNWENEGSSIWTWEEQQEHIKGQIENLEDMKDLICEYGEDAFDIYFYDSY